MLLSENVLKWVLRAYPPLLFQRIWVIGIDKNYRGVQVKINKTFLTGNYNRSIFGGTIFSAVDPFYPVLFHQVFVSRGYKNIKVWLRSADIHYKKPAYTDLFFSIKLTEADINDAEHILTTIGKYKRTYPVELFDTNDRLCVIVQCEVYIRNLDVAIEQPNEDESNNE